MAERLPRELLGESIDGVELVLVDEAAAGCISTWVNSSSPLDYQRRQWLRSCRADVDLVLPSLEGTPAGTYFARIAEMADLVLADW